MTKKNNGNNTEYICTQIINEINNVSDNNGTFNISYDNTDNIPNISFYCNNRIIARINYDYSHNHYLFISARSISGRKYSGKIIRLIFELLTELDNMIIG